MPNDDGRGEFYLYSFDDEGNPVRLKADKITEAMNNINTDHSYIHRGIGYQTEFKIPSLTAGSSKSLLLKTGVDKYNHIKNIGLNGLGASLRVEIKNSFSGSNITNSGSELLDINNLNDNINNPAKSELRTSGVSFTGTSGSSWHSFEIKGNSAGNQVTSGELSQNPNEEIVTKNDSYYHIKILNISSADDAVDVYFRMFLYEEKYGS
ncbi:MAG: hypothetical protein ACQEQF_00435 [Bacillota bacterium]